MKDVYPVALKSKRVVEIAIALINIFKFLGPPLILHSDNGREFSNIAKLIMCTNMEAMEALDKAILERSELDEVNVALTRSEIA